MKRRIISTLGVVASLLVAAPMYAKELDIKWHQPQNYTDVKGAGESDARYQKRVFKQFEKHLNKLMDDLPENTKLVLTIKDVNLAGDVRYNFNMHREIRLVKDIYWPKIKFDFKLFAKGQLVDQGEVTLKDMAFMNRGGLLSKSHDSLKYDKRLFTEWFKSTIQPKLEQHERTHNAVMTS